MPPQAQSHQWVRTVLLVVSTLAVVGILFAIYIQYSQNPDNPNDDALAIRDPAPLTSRPHEEVIASSAPAPGGGLRIGDIPVSDPDFGARYRARYARSEGQTVPVVIKRGGADRTVTMPVRSRLRTVETIVTDRNASPKAMRIRSGILRGML